MRAKIPWIFVAIIISSLLASKANAQKLCVETDHGWDIYRAGEILFGADHYSDSCIDSNSSYLLEQYCPSPYSKPLQDIVACPPGYVCSYGECVPEKELSQELKVCPEPRCFTQNARRCDPTNPRKYQVCLWDSTFRCFRWSEAVYCPSEYVCRGGYCVKTTSPSGTSPDGTSPGGQSAKNCKEIGDRGVDIYKKGKVYYKGELHGEDICVYGNVKEYYCREISDTPGVVFKGCGPGYKCENGACVKTEMKCVRDSDCPSDRPVCREGVCAKKAENGGGTRPSQGCRETDAVNGNGRNYYKKGTTSSPYGTKTDECIDERRVREYWCAYGPNDPRISQFDFLCPKKCRDGACVREEDVTDKCIDNDGLNKFKKDIAKRGKVVKEDKCQWQRAVYEAYCPDENSDPEYISIYCGYGYVCSDGKCVQETKEPPKPKPSSTAFEISLRSGWSFISVPKPISFEALKENSDCENLFGPYYYNSITNSWGVAIDLRNMLGYAIYTSASCTLKALPDKVGTERNSEILQRGWNIISSRNSWNDIKGNCEKLSPIWKFNGAKYEKVGEDENLNDKEGYWVFVKSSCTIRS